MGGPGGRLATVPLIAREGIEALEGERYDDRTVPGEHRELD